MIDFENLEFFLPFSFGVVIFIWVGWDVCMRGSTNYFETHQSISDVWMMTIS